MELPELLAPAGNLKKLKIALDYGADAVYCGGKNFGLRARADNFDRSEIERAVEYAHQREKKVYVTANILPHNNHLQKIVDYLSFLEEADVDGVIVSDPGVIYLIEENNIDVPLHLSTQASTVNWAGARFWSERGLKRIILARELSRTEIKEIIKKSDVEVEIFIHGAMCISYSGRCLLSSYMTGRDANVGDCAQPCRWKYKLVEEERPGEYFPITQDKHGTYILNSRDLNLLSRLPEVIELGVDSIKIEGRMKSVNYVATVTSVYRAALDEFARSPEEYVIRERWQKELNKISHRPYTEGFFDGDPGEEGQNYKSSSYIRPYRFLGIVQGYLPEAELAIVKVKNKFSPGDEVEIFGPGCRVIRQKVEKIYDAEGNEIEAARHPESTVKMEVNEEIGENYIIRREKDES